MPARYFIFIPMESWDALIDECDIGGGPSTGCVGEAAEGGNGSPAATRRSVSEGQRRRCDRRRRGQGDHTFANKGTREHIHLASEQIELTRS